MSNRIGPLAQSDLDAFVEIMAGAYPGMKIDTVDDRQRLRNRLLSTYEEPSTTIYGLRQQGRLVAGMILYDFSMNVRGEMMLAGGLGSLAVDLLDRKRKAAKEMVSYYLEHYRQKSAALALLYPFRTDFYRRMGFGYGTKMNQYLFRPRALRVSTSERSHIQYLDVDDLQRVLACYERFVTNTHGMILGSERQLKQVLSNPAIRTVGYVDGGQVLGYFSFDFDRRGHFLKNDLRLRQLLYEDSAVLQELLAFLQSLSDQFEWIGFNTQDNSFHHLLDDPRNRNDDLIPSVYHESNKQGVGLMYRIVDLRLLFESAANIRFGSQPLSLKIVLEDSFRPGNRNGLVVRFRDGRARLPDDESHDAVIQMDVSDFSSMFMGAISLEQLVSYGLATVSEPRLTREISELFAAVPEPVCMTAF
ncbi:MAG: GNAT family N-acetyltransferase [Chloroflexota bacterium]